MQEKARRKSLAFRQTPKKYAGCRGEYGMRRPKANWLSRKLLQTRARIAVFPICPLVWRFFSCKAEEMSGLKTLVSACFVASVLGAQAGANTANLAVTMAGCAGRLSAELEHAWLMRDSRSSILQQQRESFVAILEAIAPAGRSKELLAHRIDAKHAHAQLLHLATFGGASNRAVWAKKQSRYYKDRCTSLLLDS